MTQIILAATLWGLLGPVAYVALREGVSPLEIAFWRAAMAAVLYAAHAAVRGSWRIARGDLPAVVAFGAVGVSVFYGSYMLAVERGGAALAAVLLYTAPAWVALLARIFLGERLGVRKLVALAATLAGVVLVATAGGGEVRAGATGIALGLVAGWSYALYYLFGRRYFARYEAAGVLALALPVGALGLLPFVDFVPKGGAAWGALVFLAVVPTYGAYLLYGAGLRRVEATRAATVATIEPVVAAVAAYAVFGERLSPMGYVGAAVVLGGVLLVVSERAVARK
ncbi:MAG TPA: EamA family transporter [Gemmatimonadales bacterium]